MPWMASATTRPDSSVASAAAFVEAKRRARTASRQALLAQKRWEVPAAANHSLNEHIVSFDSIEHNVVADRERA